MGAEVNKQTGMVFKLKRVITRQKNPAKVDSTTNDTSNGVAAAAAAGVAAPAGAPMAMGASKPNVNPLGTRNPAVPIVRQAGPVALASSVLAQSKPKDSKLPNGTFETLPSFRDVPSSDRQSLFVRKLNLCCYLFDFTESSKNVKEKEIKRQTLLELVDYVTSGPGKFTESVLEDITKMLVVNLFRTLPPSSHENTGSDSFDAEEEEPTMEPAWPHLQIVYEFLLRYVVSSETDAKFAKRYIDQAFVLKLLDLFDSEDPREREYLNYIESMGSSWSTVPLFGKPSTISFIASFLRQKSTMVLLSFLKSWVASSMGLRFLSKRSTSCSLFVL